eukprot:TRINITY_DN11311_c0_g1_i2.p1 TRINITY_DN11311_c0_g1~~TRINITY_DN11311_c0_g1_i2.p1  ORF type:complete len:131 (+),score=8.25 TRINITY_DN11311_c0_g1_i2:203-595(+)
MAKFVGKIAQIPPKFSALKVKFGGKSVRAYKLARKNEDFEMQPRIAEICAISPIKRLDSQHFSYEIGVKSGFYVRSFVDFIGKNLKNYAVMQDLTRLRQGAFTVENTLNLGELSGENIDRVNVYKNMEKK